MPVRRWLTWRRTSGDALRDGCRELPRRHRLDVRRWSDQLAPE